MPGAISSARRTICCPVPAGMKLRMPLNPLVYHGVALLSLQRRRLDAELMDQPHLDAEEHRRALGGLHRLNVASGVCRQIWREIVGVRSHERGGPLRILDVASGGGDVAWGLWTLARRQGRQLQILGLDMSAVACAYASHQCRDAGQSIAFRQANVLCEPLPTGFDVVICSLFLHHLAWNDASRLLSEMAAAGRVLVVSDLRRCAAGYALAHAACRVLSRSPVVQYDGPRSVANAFSFGEMKSLSAAAGLEDATVRAAWPCRLMVVHQGS